MRSALALVPLAAVAACSGPKLEVKRGSTAPIAHRVAAVYPYAFRWDEPAWRSYQKSMDIVLFLTSKGRLLVFGPDDFQVLRTEEPNALLGSDIVRALRKRGLDPRGFLVFRGWAERRIARSAAGVEGSRGIVRAQSSEEIAYLAHLEVVDALSGEAVLEVSGQVEAGDPTQRPDYDPMPELTELHRRLVRAAWAELEGRLASPPLREAPLRVRWLPASTLDYAPGTQLALRERMLAMDALDAEVIRLSVYRYFAPGVADQRLSRDLELPGGLLVERALGAFEQFLRPGDVIIVVNGEPALGPQVLQRAVNLPPQAELLLRVARSGSRLELAVPWPSAEPRKP